MYHAMLIFKLLFWKCSKNTLFFSDCQLLQHLYSHSVAVHVSFRHSFLKSPVCFDRSGLTGLSRHLRLCLHISTAGLFANMTMLWYGWERWLYSDDIINICCPNDSFRSTVPEYVLSVFFPLFEGTFRRPLQYSACTTLSLCQTTGIL